jgi:endonuclease YncB( thermonuclease family)
MGASCTKTLCCATLVSSQNAKYIPSGIKKKDYPKYVPQITQGRVVDVYDGDTITIVGYVKHNPELFRFSVRLNGIDCPEMRTKNPNEKLIAGFAKKYLHDIISDKVVTLEDVGLDKYGRLLAKVIFGPRDVAKELVEKNMAVPYDGGTKVCPDDWLTFYLEKNKLTEEQEELVYNIRV